MTTMLFDLSIELIFRVGSTGDIKSIAKTMNIPEDQLHEFLKNTRWYETVNISGGRDFDNLPVECPSVGSTIILFESAVPQYFGKTMMGRIDRYQVIAPNTVSNIFSPNEKPVKFMWGARNIGHFNRFIFWTNAGMGTAFPVERIVIVDSSRDIN